MLRLSRIFYLPADRINGGDDRAFVLAPGPPERAVLEPVRGDTPSRAPGRPCAAADPGPPPLRAGNEPVLSGDVGAVRVRPHRRADARRRPHPGAADRQGGRAAGPRRG